MIIPRTLLFQESVDCLPEQWWGDADVRVHIETLQFGLLEVLTVEIESQMIRTGIGNSTRRPSTGQVQCK